MYTQYRASEASACLVLPEGTPARDGASSFVNPLTALGMIETMRREGHSGLVHTAAASNLGQMLVKLCLRRTCRSSTSCAGPSKRSSCDRSAPSMSATPVHRRSSVTSGTPSPPRRPRSPSTPRVEGISPVRSSPPWRRPLPIRHGVLAVRVERSQAGVHLWRPRPEPDHLDEDFWFRLERGRVAAHAVPAEHRPGAVR